MKKRLQENQDKTRNQYKTKNGKKKKRRNWNIDGNEKGVKQKRQQLNQKH